MLTSEKFIEAKNYIINKARLLDKALFGFEFEGGSKEKVLSELKKYQNEDGGFGKALEPDIRMAESSVITTTVAIQYLNEIKEYPQEIIVPAIEYLLSSIQKFPENSPIKYFWYPRGLNVNNAPHAPWWSVKELDPPNVENWPNPSVEVIGYLFQFSEYVPNKLLKELESDITAYLLKVPAFSGFYYYNFLCFKRILNFIPKNLQKEIFSMFNQSFSNKSLLDAKNFENIKVQWMVTEKSSYLFQNYPEIMKILLETEIKRLNEYVGSQPGWKWGDEELWNKIKKEWTGKLTCELLIALKYCELIEKSVIK